MDQTPSHHPHHLHRLRHHLAGHPPQHQAEHLAEHLQQHLAEHLQQQVQDLAYYQSGLRRIYCLLADQRHLRQRQHHRRLRLLTMMPLGVQFKPDLYEKVLHPLKCKTHIIGGLHQRWHPQQNLRQHLLQANLKVDGL